MKILLKIQYMYIFMVYNMFKYITNPTRILKDFFELFFTKSI